MQLWDVTYRRYLDLDRQSPMQLTNTNPISFMWLTLHLLISLTPISQFTLNKIILSPVC